jgi:glycosyltransferase involved in cell wall biosynthesis
LSKVASNLSDKHSISVIIPAYNRAELIGETLRSLLNQTVPAREIILVDDGSTDGTAESAEREFSVFRERFSGISKSNIPNPTFKILRQQNAGPGAARNRGLAEATGEFIHFFDSDDIAALNKHEVQLRALLETGADIAYAPWVKGRFAPKQAQTVASGELSVASLDSVDTRYHLPAIIYSGFTPEGPVLQAKGLPKGDLLQALLTNWSVVPHACLFRRSILEKAGGFPEDIWVGEDQLLFLRCLLAGAKVVHTPETMIFYRLGDDGKLTESKDGHVRRVTHWAKFLSKANQEVASADKACNRDPLPFTTMPSSLLGFCLRAYEAWKDLLQLDEHDRDLEKALEKIWKRGIFSGLGLQVSSFLLCKWGGLKHRIFGHRWSSSFRCGVVDKKMADSILQ